MLPETVAAIAAGDRVAVACLFEFQFASATKRFWDGLNDLSAGGSTWQGAGALISASGLELPTGLNAPQASFTLSGATPELIAYAAASESEVTGRPARAFVQFLSSAIQTLDDPIAVWAGHMDVMSFRAGVKDQSISLSAETLFVGRVRAPYGFMTDTDQQARWPGDRGMEFMASLMNKTVTFLRG